ncbi:RtcB family protein [Corynebacterium freiburgense]|uniref:RtcB family protein n=1 Tax=Corynebacterium freiburgense TaxID=556548 RepID=UPI000426097D|nr:RtcB family protein [Corynebacterium freiburgense]WJZ02614.1 RNA-splicing ligase RtcB [Corynebacterium freiburgense]
MSSHPFGFPITIPGACAPVRMWSHLHEVDHIAQQQIRNVSHLPWVHGIAVMPDVHAGAGVTVGSVIAMRNAVSPATVGSDIGCGMMAVKTSATTSDLPDSLHEMRNLWEQIVPVGFAKHTTRAGVFARQGLLRQELKRLFSRFDALRVDVSASGNNAVRQCGTLGGGNHFIELCADESETLWITLHSGSRNIGKEIAERHMYRARNLEWNSGLPDRNLAVFLHRDEQGHIYSDWEDYLHDLYWAQDYAAFNRKIMMAGIQSAFSECLPGVQFLQQIQCHHNYVSEETYDDLDLIITRKGAIRTQRGELGIIPGSMGTGCYIVEGLGNIESFCSASHGAGRTMSRGMARSTFQLEDLYQQTSGVECRKDRGVLDEIPGAYKDLDQVLAYESDLVRIVARLKTLLCIKG